MTDDSASGPPPDRSTGDDPSAASPATPGWLRTSFVRLGSGTGLAFARLRYRPGRAALAILGVTIAVLSMTLLAGVGAGVVETGEESFDRADRDLWIVGGPVQVAPSRAGGLNTPVTDAHRISAELDQREDVRTAAPIAFQTVLIATPEMLEADDHDRIIGTGVPGGGSTITYTEGQGLSGSDHYANGSYDGPMSQEIVIDPQTADAYDLEVGDTLHVGGTVAGLYRNEFTVVGISPTYSELTGEATATLHLSELQTITGTSGTDEALFITITLADGADTDAVQADLQERYPQYEVRTNQEQLAAVLEDQALLIAAGLALVALAFLGGGALTANVLAMSVHQQRRELGALKAIGVSSGTLVWTTAVQGLVYSSLGAVLALALTAPSATALDALARSLTGFEGLVRVPTQAYWLGLGGAIAIGILSAGYAGWRVSRTNPLDALDR